MKTTLSLSEARQLAVSAQFLDGQSQHAVADVIQQLGYLQIDTISVVARTQEHTLWTRLPDFQAAMLYAAQREERSIFEYWGHAMSYLPMQDYRYYLPTMQSFHSPNGNWAKSRYEKVGHLIEPVLQRVKEEGPLKSRDFEAPKSEVSRTWWDWHPEKIVLELLLWRGDLMVVERQGFQKIYDLAERVLPNWVDTSFPTDLEVGRYVVKRALRAYGLATEKEIRTFLHEVKNGTVQAGIQSFLEEGSIQVVEIDSLPGECYYMAVESLENTLIPSTAAREVHILSPFDNLIIQRARIAKLFDFQYSLECYLPAGKRAYGYYVMPILYGTQLIGRLDPKADRKTKTFLLRGIYFEESFQPDEIFFNRLVLRILEMMKFNGCVRVELGFIKPERFQVPMIAALEQLDVAVQAIQ
jgi:uncharacterized protein YcaQ